MWEYEDVMVKNIDPDEHATDEYHDRFFDQDERPIFYTDMGITARYDDMGYILPPFRKRLDECEEEMECLDYMS